MDSGRNDDNNDDNDVHQSTPNFNSELISLTASNALKTPEFSILSVLSLFLPQGLNNTEHSEHLWTALAQLSSLRHLTLAEKSAAATDDNDDLNEGNSPPSLLVSSIEENSRLQTAVSLVLGRLVSLDIARLRWPANMLHCLNGHRLHSLAFNGLLIRADEDYYGRHSSSFGEDEDSEHHFYGSLVLPADTEYAADVLLFITTKLMAIRQLKMPPDWWSLLAQMMPTFSVE
ncbi:hypothetical protein TYRP_019884 [Tyrophagus putrescentiae]|nr:hypothetical protein TYRP_019884 [Tyrophagus putrescentiae]